MIFGLVVLFGMTIPAYGCAIDTIPPSFTWISPAEFSILTTNTVRLCVDAHDDEGGSGIGKVVFYASYYDSNNQVVPLQRIGEVTEYPYEFVWLCSDIPDQNLGKLHLSCEVYDNAGNVATKPEGAEDGDYPLLVLDRNTELSNERLISRFTGKDIVIDGQLNEWSASDSIDFYNNDNGVSVYSLWNDTALYLAVRTTGRSIISHFPPGSENLVGMANEDLVEIFIDADHDHYEIFNYPDRHFLLAAAGMTYERRRYIDNGYRTELIRNPNIESCVSIDGTLNDDSDEDKDYTVEFSISWEELGVRPGNGVVMGLEIWNNDKDFIDGNYFYSGWSTVASNLANPSEWGNLELSGHPESLLGTIVVVIFGIVAAACAGFLMYRRRVLPSNALSTNTLTAVVDENEYVRKAKDYIVEHYTEETLSREDVAPVVGLTPSYFGKTFKRETGMSFSDYLTDFRIEKAKQLLTATRKNVSEIALEVGFSSQSYFTFQFKKRTEISPSEYRQISREKR